MRWNEKILNSVEELLKQGKTYEDIGFLQSPSKKTTTSLVDGNYTNNKEENLTLLCPNCHSLTKTYKGANKGNGRHNRMKRYYDGKSYWRYGALVQMARIGDLQSSDNGSFPLCSTL